MRAIATAALFMGLLGLAAPALAYDPARSPYTTPAQPVTVTTGSYVAGQVMGTGTGAPANGAPYTVLNSGYTAGAAALASPYIIDHVGIHTTDGTGPAGGFTLEICSAIPTSGGNVGTGITTASAIADSATFALTLADSTKCRPFVINNPIADGNVQNWVADGLQISTGNQFYFLLICNGSYTPTGTTGLWSVDFTGAR